MRKRQSGRDGKAEGGDAVEEDEEDDDDDDPEEFARQFRHERTQHRLAALSVEHADWEKALAQVRVFGMPGNFFKSAATKQRIFSNHGNCCHTHTNTRTFVAQSVSKLLTIFQHYVGKHRLKAQSQHHILCLFLTSSSQLAFGSREQVRPSRERSGGGGEGGAGLMTSVVPLPFSAGGGSEMSFGGQDDSTSVSTDAELASASASSTASAASAVTTIARGGAGSESHSWLVSALAQCRRVLAHAGVTLAPPHDTNVDDDNGETKGGGIIAYDNGETKGTADPAFASAEAPLSSKRRTDEMEYLSSPLSHMAAHDGLACLMLCAPSSPVPSHSSSLSAAHSADSSSSFSASSLPAQPPSHSQVRVR